MSLSINGSVESDGESFRGVIANASTGGPGGGSGGTILLFLRTLTLGEASVLSTAGGIGSRYGGGGGGGGRIHFHWSDITTGDEYVPVASVNGLINSRFVINLSTFIDCLCHFLNVYWVQPFLFCCGSNVIN